MDFLSDFLQRLALAVIPILAVVLVPLIIAQTRKLWAQAKDANGDIAYAVEQAALLAVKAAEQSGIAGQVADKKAYALTVAEGWLKAQGITVDLHLIDAAIEAAVYEQLTVAKTKPA